MTTIALSRIHFPVTTLGPGRRIGIWMQGCSIRCPGCISMDTWSADRGKTTVRAIMDAVQPWMAVADGVTVSGGEPFDQPDALKALLSNLRHAGVGDIFVYSGHPFEEIAATVATMDGLIDALMSDPFELETAQTLALRGSDNQRLHLLTAAGREHFAVYERTATGGDRRFDVGVNGDGSAWLAGIPDRGDFYRLRAMLEAAGHEIVTSDDRRIGRQNRADPS